MKHHVRRRRNAPQEIDFIVIGGMRTDIRTLSCKHRMYMQMSERRCRWMVQVFRVNVVKGSLQESPQERVHTQNDATGSHSLSLRYHPGTSLLCVSSAGKRTRGSQPGRGPGPCTVGVALAFQCQDALVIYREVTQRGIEAWEPFVGNAMWNFSLSDPDGYRIEFESPTDKPEETKLSEIAG